MSSILQQSSGGRKWTERCRFGVSFAMLLINGVSLLEIERGNGQTNPVLIIDFHSPPGLEIESGHSPRDAGAEAGPRAMADFLAMQNRREHRQHRFYHHWPCLPIWVGLHPARMGWINAIPEGSAPPNTVGAARNRAVHAVCVLQRAVSSGCAPAPAATTAESLASASGRRPGDSHL